MQKLAPLILLAIAAVAAPAHAQFLFKYTKKAPAPADLPPEQMEIWPYLPPDPRTWWDDARIKPAEASDPLSKRRLRRGETLPTPDNGIDPSTYRLWGLMPLQWQLLRSDEAIIEVWVRPSGGVRQSVVRVTARSDGKAFVQGRAGLACCEADIGRRMGFDAEAPEGTAARIQALATDPLWAAPRQVLVDHGGGAADAVCVDGTSYDLTAVTRTWTRTVRRACDDAEVGQAADVLSAVLGLALGRDSRFDVIFPRGADFSAARSAYNSLISSGGRLKPDPAQRARGAPADLAPPPPPPEETPQAPPASPALQIPGL